MKIIEWLVGGDFLKLIAEGKKTREIIKVGGNRLLQNSSPELETYYTQPAFLQAIPNPLSQAVLCILFIITYVCGAGGVLDYFELSPPIYVLFFFSPMIVMAVFISSMPWAIGRGYLWGVNVILYLYVMGVIIMLLSFCFIYVGYFKNSINLKRLEFSPVQVVIFYLTRVIINGDSLSRLVSYYRLKRIAREAYKIRIRQTGRDKK